MGKAREREVQIVCMFEEQEVEDGAQILAISLERFQRLKEWEEAVMEMGESKRVTFDGVLMVLNNADGFTASTEVAMERGWAIWLRGDETGAMDWALWELKPWEHNWWERKCKEGSLNVDFGMPPIQEDKSFCHLLSCP